MLDAAGTPASSLSTCRETRFGPTWKNFTDYRGNGTYAVVLRYYNTTGDSDCNGAVTERSFKYTVNAGTAVATPPGRALTRDPNGFLTKTYQLGVALNPGASTYEVRYARGGVTGPDGAISGPSSETFVDRNTGLADFRFDKPGRWLIVARVKADDFYTPWSAPVNATAIAPFDIDRVSFPDARGPSYKLRGQIRERLARGKVTISIARGKKNGKFRRIGTAKINSKGRFTKRFTVRKTGPTGSGTRTRAPRSWPVAASPSRCASAAACSSARRRSVVRPASPPAPARPPCATARCGGGGSGRRCWPDRRRPSRSALCPGAR